MYDHLQFFFEPFTRVKIINVISSLSVKNLEEKIQRCLQMLVGDKRLGKL